MDDTSDTGSAMTGGRNPVDLKLDWVLGKMPQKVRGKLRPLENFSSYQRSMIGAPSGSCW